jgi:hypothetical protein
VPAGSLPASLSERRPGTSGGLPVGQPSEWARVARLGSGSPQGPESARWRMSGLGLSGASAGGFEVAFDSDAAGGFEVAFDATEWAFRLSGTHDLKFGGPHSQRPLADRRGPA